MKTKKIIVLALLAILVSSCICWGVRDVDCYLTDVQKQFIPYKEGQVFSFTKSTGQTLDFTVSGVQVVPFEYRLGAYCTVYVVGEEKFASLRSESGTYRINIRSTFNSSHSCCGYRSLQISITNMVFVLNAGNEGVFLISDDFTFLFDSLEINGKVYYDVVKQKRLQWHNVPIGSDERLEPTSWQLFYNKTYGILQIKRDGENFLVLNN